MASTGKQCWANLLQNPCQHKCWWLVACLFSLAAFGVLLGAGLVKPEGAERFLDQYTTEFTVGMVGTGFGAITTASKFVRAWKHSDEEILTGSGLASNWLTIILSVGIFLLAMTFLSPAFSWVTDLVGVLTPQTTIMIFGFLMLLPFGYNIYGLWKGPKELPNNSQPYSQFGHKPAYIEEPKGRSQKVKEAWQNFKKCSTSKYVAQAEVKESNERLLLQADAGYGSTYPAQQSTSGSARTQQTGGDVPVYVSPLSPQYPTTQGPGNNGGINALRRRLAFAEQAVKRE